MGEPFSGWTTCWPCVALAGPCRCDGSVHPLRACLKCGGPMVPVELMAGDIGREVREVVSALRLAGLG